GNNGDASFALYTPTSSTNYVALGSDNPPVYPVRYALFDITGASQGDQFNIAVSSATGYSIGNAFGISAIAAAAIVTPDPSTAMLLGVGGLLLWRSRRITRHAHSCSLMLFAVCGILIVSGTICSATLLPVVNPSFELGNSPSLQDNQTDFPTGWGT